MYSAWTIFFVGVCVARVAAVQSAGFVRAQGTGFALDGARFVVTGVNNYYLAYVDASSVDNVMAAAAQSGANVVRCWAYLQGTDSGVTPFESLQSPGNVVVNNAALVQIDQLIASAAKNGVRVLLVLANNWSAYGGLDQLNAWAGHQYHDQWFTDPVTIAWYQSFVRALLTRVNSITGTVYSRDPAIFGYNLINEPRCAGTTLPASPQCNCATISQWIAQQAAFIKSIDTNHLLSSGSEGFFAWEGYQDWTYNGGEGVSFDSLITTSDIDYETFHLYPTSWNKDQTWALQFIQDHLRQAEKAGKPVVLEEYGYTDPAQRVALYKAWTQPMCASGGSMLWMLASQVDGSWYSHDDGFLVLSDGSPNNAAVLNALRVC